MQPSSIDLSKIPPEYLASRAQEIAEDFKRRIWLSYKPHPKQEEFHKAGTIARERMFMGGNRTGKTRCGAVEMAFHLTGRYPKDWNGVRFEKPIKAWAATLSKEMVANVMQVELFGGFGFIGIGTIRPADIVRKVTWQGVANCYQNVQVRHISGGISEISFKSYDQGWEAFQGAKRDVIWLDEEPDDPKIYTECSIRITSFDAGEQAGIMMMTMTPLHGLTQLLLENFLLNGVKPGELNAKGKVFIQAGWEDNIHLSKEERMRLMDTTPAHELEARSNGTPAIGRGKVYPIEESKIKCERFEIPKGWPRVYGMDFGWTNPTACIFMAHDRDTDTVYCYAEYYQKEKTPDNHAAAIMAYGKWITGVCDPAGLQADKRDGVNLFDLYVQQGLLLQLADNSRESGIMKLLQRMKDGKFKVFSDLENWWFEFRTYARDAHNVPKKENDHLMDATRYAIVSGLQHAMTERQGIDLFEHRQEDGFDNAQRDEHTGY